MHVYPAVLIVAMFFVAALPISSPPSLAETDFHTNTFGNGQRSVTVAFNTAGMEDSASLSLQTGLSIDDASMKISTVPPPPGNWDSPRNVFIDFGSDGLPEWGWNGPGVGGFGVQSMFMTDKSFMNVSIPNTGSNVTNAIRLPKNARVTSASMSVVSGGGTLGGAGKILLCIADSISVHQSLQTRLLTFPDVTQVDMVTANTVTPTLAELKQYSSVFVQSNNVFQNQATLGNNLADYVDAGGGVVVATFAHSGSYAVGGRFVSDGYCAITSGVGYSSGTATR